jgi:hypothetical protein
LYYVLSNAYFEQGSQNWRPLNNAASVTVSVVRDGTAKSGSSFLRARTAIGGGSVANDFPAGFVIREGLNYDVQRSMGVFAWLRAKPGSPSIPGAMTIWQLNAPGNNNHPNTQFTVGNDWTLIVNAIDLVPENDPVPKMRVEFLHFHGQQRAATPVWSTWKPGRWPRTLEIYSKSGPLRLVTHGEKSGEIEPRSRLSFPWLLTACGGFARTGLCWRP